MAGSLDVIKTAAGIPGIMGVELQVTQGAANLRDWDVVRQYKKEAHRWGMHIPALAGVWDKGVNIGSPSAPENLQASIRAAEMLGARVILLAFFGKDAPDMASEASYGPIVAMLQQTAKNAEDAGVVMGLENSLSPSDNKKLVDLVDHPAVGVYYDAYNMARFGYAGEAVEGIATLGKSRICMVHVKNGGKPVESPDLFDWADAFREFSAIQYDGWFVYETAHGSIAECIEDTARNNDFMRKHVQMPKG